MRKNFILLLIAALFVTMTACEKEGSYSPSKKISKIFSESTFSNGKQLDEIWTWEDDLLTKIASGLDNSFRHFDYDGSQLKAIRYSNGNKMEYSYDGGKLINATLYDSSNEPKISLVFEHVGSKISTLTMTYYSSILKSSDEVFAGLDDFFADPIMKESVKKQIVNCKAKLGTEASTNIFTYKFEWDGDNIKNLLVEYYEDEKYHSYTQSFTYDKMLNPFYKSLDFGMTTITLGGITSKNNITKIVSEVEGEYDEESYSYTYDGKFPTEVICYGDYGDYYATYYEYED